MPNPIRISCFALLAIGLAVCPAEGSELRGTVKVGNLVLPGATVSATRGERRVLTTTDAQGIYVFPELADGEWTVEVEMLGFEKERRPVVIAAGAPALDWTLKFMTEKALLASLAPAASTPALAQAGPPAGAARTAAEGRPAQAAAASQAPAAAVQAQARQRLPLNGAQHGTGQANGQRNYQSLSVNQSSDASTYSSEGAIRSEEVADLSQNAANSFIVQGSMSTALTMQQSNDWGPRLGPDMMGMMGDPGMGGPGMGGPGGTMGGAGGPGGVGSMAGGGMMGGGMMGGPGGAPGGGGPGGGPGGMMGGPGGFGGRGGFAGRTGDRNAWQNRGNARAFGNNRRDPRNSYMGNVSLNLTNSALDARSYSVTGADLGKPDYSNARGSVMFGGPLQIPKLVSKDRHIFFSVNYSFQRNRTGSTSDPVNMPTALERTGDFSQTLLAGANVVVYDPASGAPFPGAKIPTSRLNAASLGLLQYYPLPNLPYATRNYQTSLNGHSNMQNLNARLSNIQLTKRDRLNFGLGFQKSDSETPNLFQFTDSGSGSGLNSSLGWSRSFTARLTNSVQFSFSRMRQETIPYFAYGSNIAATLGILGTSTAAANYGPPSLSFTNYGGLNDGNYSLNRNQSASISESLIWVHGQHNYTFGGEFRRQQFNPYSDQNGRGSFSFNGSATALALNGVVQSGTGYDLADFLLGTPTTASLRYGNPDKYFRGSSVSFHVNDDWRLKSKFTINYGLRWDYSTPVSELYNRLVNLAIAPGYTAITPIQPGDNSSVYGGLPAGLVHQDRNNFSPRVGFAWRPGSKDSLVVRGGYGVYYNTSVYNLVASNMAQQPPLATTLSVAGSSANPLSLQNAFLAASAQSTTPTFAIDPNYRIGYAQTWNLTLQHNLPFSMFGTAGYLGTKGTRLDQQFIPNSVAPGASESLLPHSYIYETSGGNSIYHAAQFQLNRRSRGGFLWRGSYQFSKSIDDAGTGGRGQGGTPVAQNWLDLSAERALSSFDARHNMNLMLQYSTGQGRSGGTLLNGWKGALLKDWTVSGNFTIRSGTPLTAVVGGARSQLSGTAVANTLRADSSGASISADGLLFNTAAFTQPASGSWGNAGRNTIPGPTVFSLNGSLDRVIRFGERRSLDLRIQTQNMLNHPTITGWGTTLGSSTYGLATSAAAMRKVTAEIRFRF